MTSSDPWADLSTYACATCRFFVPKLSRGRCRRHAPTMDGYPVVNERDWCGDHKLGTNPSRVDAEAVRLDLSPQPETGRQP